MTSMKTIDQSGRETGSGIRAAIREIKRRNYRMSIFAPSNEGKKSDISLLLLDYLRGAKIVAVAAVLVLSASILNGQGYDTYIGNAGLVTIAQKEQAKQEREAEKAFRGMSIADRWNQNDAGSLARRWSDTGPGSIARRWAK